MENLTLESLNEKINNLNDKFDNMKNDILDFKAGVKENVTDLKSDVKELSKLLSDLSKNVIDLTATSKQTSISVQLLSETVKKNSEDIDECRNNNKRGLEETNKIVEEIRNRPMAEAYEQKVWLNKKVRDAIFAGLLVLLTLGVGTYIGTTVAKQNIQIANEK